MENLTRFPPPLSVLSQFMPAQYEAITQCRIANAPVPLVLSKVMEVTGKYAHACGL
jgi:D-tagatose-1,6-bisphosphate aldolase subunit GatZ/KbaZ